MKGSERANMQTGLQTTTGVSLDITFLPEVNRRCLQVNQSSKRKSSDKLCRVPAPIEWVGPGDNLK
jgi:hypothetical protein